MRIRITTVALLVFTVMISVGLRTDVHGAGNEDAESRVMVLPFDGTSAGDFRYLTDSIGAMISSRLAAREGIELVDHVVRADDLKRLGTEAGTGETSLFTKYNVDYIVTGALYAMQTGLKLQVVVSGKDDQGPARLSVLAENEENIFPKVEELVADIAGRAMGLEVSQDAVGGAADGESGLAGFTTEHPEKIYKKGIYTGAIISEGAEIVRSRGVKKSSKLPLTIVSMAVADLDGDGFQEIVSASRGSLLVSRFNETRFADLAEYEFRLGYKINGINIADVDNDGTPEIYVSANDGLKVSSSVFVFRDSGLEPLAMNINWYLRPVQWPGKGLILAGQRGNDRPEDGFVASRVSQLKVTGNFAGFEVERTLPLPKNVRLFDFEWIELDGNGGPELVAVDQREKLLVYDNRNSIIWVSEEDFGGSRNHYGQPWSAVEAVTMRGGDNESGGNRENIYIPTRIIAKDVDGDGTMEIIIGRNERLYGKLLNNTREYDGGTITCLSWRDGRLQELWRTNKLKGYVADYGLIAATSTGSEGDGVELYVAQIPEKLFFGFAFSSDSKLLRYDIAVQEGE